MARAAVPVFGGPFDGAEWEADGNPFRDVAFGDEWYVYRRTQIAVRSRVRWGWEFMGDHAHRCLGCDAVVEVPRTKPCPLCGAAGPWA